MAERLIGFEFEIFRRRLRQLWLFFRAFSLAHQIDRRVVVRSVFGLDPDQSERARQVYLSWLARARLDDGDRLSAIACEREP